MAIVASVSARKEKRGIDGAISGCMQPTGGQWQQSWAWWSFGREGASSGGNPSRADRGRTD